ncbi:MAG TPA: hypothetical protein VLX44_02460 [Xanthobacteraceae bacterium]|nr:hypothetical protein [Xanthobacteraceae bacterium]
MSLSKYAVVACGLLMATATAASAEDLRLTDRTAIIVRPSGETQVIHLNDRGHAIVLKNSRVTGSATLVYQGHGKIYIMQDRPAANGGTLLDRDHMDILAAS